MMFDLLALAFQADSRRVSTSCSEGTNRNLQPLGVPDAFHPVSQRQRSRTSTTGEDRPAVQMFSQFREMAATPDGDGTLSTQSSLRSK